MMKGNSIKKRLKQRMIEIKGKNDESERLNLKIVN